MTQPPSPAPHRRRRPQAEVPTVPPSRSTRVIPIETIDDEPPHRTPSRTPGKKPPLSPVRMIAFCVLLVLFITGVVFITRGYLAHQEERRRLEAEAAERAQHPLYYGDMIASYSAAQGLDPSLVAAVILCESSYNPQAESRLGARGLMQLMEDTAGWIAHKLNEDGENYSFDLLYDPETNIRFGTWYLGYLSRRFDGDATKIVCAYHAGQGNVDSWLSNPQYSKDGVTLDVIPTKDTAAYASRVLRARSVYQKYYFKPHVLEETTD